MNIKSYLLLMFVTLNFKTYASNSSKLKERPSKILERIINKFKLSHDHLGYFIFDLSDQKVFDQFNSQETFSLASISKIFTSIYSLENLPNNYKFETTAHINGNIKNGLLTGDLIITGTGDPLLSSVDLMNLALEIKSLGINKINGDIIIDDNFIFAKHEISSLGLGDETYNSGISALNSDFNRLSILKVDSRKNLFVTVPSLDHIKISSSRHVFKNNTKFKYQFSGKKTEEWQTSKKMKYKSIENLPIKKPSLYTANLLRFYLEQLGIRVNDINFYHSQEKDRLIWSHSSENISKIVQLTLEFSNNLLAESLLLRASKTELNKKYTLNQAAKKMKEYLEKNYKDLNWNNTKFENGSGLTSENISSPKTTALFLSSIFSKKFNDKYYLTYLSQSGRSGWIKNRLNSKSLAYKVWAKTGSLDYVSNIAGFILGDSGKQYAFAVFVQDKDKRKILNNFNNETSKNLKKKAPRWKKITNSMTEEIIEHWIKTL